MRVRRDTLAIGLCLTALWGTAIFIGCNAGVSGSVGGFGGAGGSSGASKGSAQGGAGSTTTGVTSATGFGVGGMGGMGVDVPKNPCGTQCGAVELCDGVNKGIDDNCDGVVDEGCPCSPGEAESCFKGDPSYLTSPGCHPGTQKCSENGVWGACVGGNHATEMCFDADPLGCHAISAVPFATVDLVPGAGNFTNNADPGSGDYSIACPPGVTPCPTVDNSGNVTVLVSGEYTVTYTKTVNGSTDMCTYPLYVGAPGIRVELSWDFPTSGGTTDLDLHMHEPGTTDPWGQSTNPDCGFGNCKVYNFPGTGPTWFMDAPQPAGTPTNWDLNPMMNQNSCYYAPRGVGAQWQAKAMGCHNPRLDLDNITCSPSITDPQDSSFCAPENINLDIPPKDTWIRVGAHYYPGTSSYSGTTHPDVKIYCDGQLAAELGTHGFNNPETPIAWQFSQTDQFWQVADIEYKVDQCSKGCTVKPIYKNGDDTTRLPVYSTSYPSGAAFAPAYPPP